MLSEPIRELIRQVVETERVIRTKETKGEDYEINKIITKAATLYEKVRYLIDYKEEHSIRRSAIERILKRKVLFEGQGEIGTSLVVELIGAQYISKEHNVGDLEKKINGIVRKYLALSEAADGGNAFHKKLLSFAASEIDSHLAPIQFVIDKSTTDAFYKTVRSNVIAPGINEKEVDIQLYCACRRALLGSDNEILSYALWLLYVPRWQEMNNEEIKTFASNVHAILQAIDGAVKNSLQWRLAQKIKNETIYFLIIRELIGKYGIESERIINTPEELDSFTRSFLEEKYKKENIRIKSSGIRAVTYLLFTKLMLAFVLELPYELVFVKEVNYIPLTTNVLFHPALLFVLTRRIGKLDETNTKAIITGIHGILYEDKIRPIKISTGLTGLAVIFAFLYGFLVVFVFGMIVTILRILHFNIVSIALFLFFLALVSYFAYRIRYNARRWKIINREGTLSLIGSVLAVPVVRTGRWLSQTFSSINVLVFIMDFMIETPFKFLLQFSNQFISYLKEKAEEVH